MTSMDGERSLSVRAGALRVAEAASIFGQTSALGSAAHDPPVRTITANGYEAIWVKTGGGGVFEDNDLSGNDLGAWDMAEDTKADVTAHNDTED